MAYLPGRKVGRRKKGRRGSADKPPSRESEYLDIDLEKLKGAYGELEAAHREVRESHIEMIFNLAIAAECKDADTGGHIVRISDYATEVAKALGLFEEEMDALRYGSPMHDIGKIGIPDKILQKPGKLNPEEWEIMKQHTVIGARIFQNSRSPILKAASEIALCHHERFDGSGYPRALQGESIPLFGRIVGMVDVFDAIVSKRCYKAASTFEEAVEYIRSQAGTHLDPKLVKVFLKIEKKIRKIYDANTTIRHFVNDFEKF